jgi:surface antigen
MSLRTRTLVSALAACVTLAFVSPAAHAEDYWQCAAFARVFSGIQIFGDAWTWWEKATGHYLKGSTPKAGAVLVFRPQGAMRLGHVAVVSQVLTDRIIQVTHANWSLIDGSRGKIEQNVTVVDVSPGGDWTEVKVWYDPLRDLGTTTYSTYGFVYNTAVDNAGTAARNAALTVAQNTLGSMAAAVTSPSGTTPVQAFAKDSTDKIASLIQSVIGGGDAPASK